MKGDKISLCMIVRDEEKNIKRCLDSVYDLVDEIIIVDTGSVDKTKEILLHLDYAYKIQLYDFEWCDDFSKARNYSFSKATCEWIFWCDADDIIYKKDCDKIRTILKDDDGRTDGYLFTYCYNHDEQGKSIYDLSRERLIKRSSNPIWFDPCHEYIDISSYNLIKRDDVFVHHFRSLEENTKDAGRNLTIMKRFIKERWDDQRFLFYYGDELRYVGDFKEAIKVYKHFIELSIFNDEKFKAIYYVALCYKEMMKLDETKEYCLKALQLDWRFAEPYFLLGEIAKSRQNWLEAAHWFETCLKLKPPFTNQSVNLECYSWKPFAELELIYNSLGRIEEARDMCLELIKIHPDSESLRNDLKAFNIATRRDIEKIPDVFKINLGSGGQKKEGFVSCDLYDQNADLKIDMKELPFLDRSVDEIYSEHSLEHLPQVEAFKALDEMARVLKPFGKLTLKVPDLIDCCTKLIESYIGEHKDKVLYDWYKWTLFGRQVTDDKIDLGQFHKTGFSERELSEYLMSIGFVLTYCEKYDGYDTPSIHIEVIKQATIGWFAKNEDMDSATVRIRRLNIHKYLCNEGEIKTVLLNRVSSENYDATFKCDFVVFTSFGKDEIDLAKRLKKKNIKCLYDHNEALLGFPMVNETLKEMDVVICCSNKLAELTSKINSNVMVIPDAYEEEKVR